MTGLEIRVPRPEDEGALQAAAALLGCARTAAERAWLASHAGASRARVALVPEDGRVLGHYACVPRTTWIAAREAVFAEVLDAFAPRAEARGLQREGPYARLGRALAQAHSEDLVHHGYFGRAEWRMANALLDFEVVRNQCLLVRSSADAGAPALEELVRFDHQAKWLWERCSGRFGAAAIRDEGYLNWRFVERPGVRYQRRGLRDANGILRGLYVYRSGAFAGRSGGWLVEWIVPPEEPEVGERLLGDALAAARADGQRELACALPEWSPWFEAFQRAGFRVVASEAVLAARCFARKYDEVWLRDHWWTTLADTLAL